MSYDHLNFSTEAARHYYCQEELRLNRLEFSRELRIIDPIDELGFLTLECERLGSPRLGWLLLHSYRKESGDHYPPELLAFYQSYRACLRARIAIRHLNEEKYRYSAEWRRRALDYLDLAEQHLPSAN